MRDVAVERAYDVLPEGVAKEEVQPGGDWLFVGCWPRTGSTAVVEMLNQHPDVFCGCEHGVISMLLGVLTSERYYVAGEDGFHYKANLGGGWSWSDLRTFAETWRTCRAPGANVVGDKGYLYWSHRDLLRQVFPGCKFLFPHRHPLDMLASWFTINPAMAEGPVETWEGQLRRYVAAVEEALQEPDVLTLEFEALGVLETRTAMMDNVLSFVGVETPSDWAQKLRPFDAPAGAIGRFAKDRTLKRLSRTVRDEVVKSYAALLA